MIGRNISSTNSHRDTVSRIASGQRASFLADGMYVMAPRLDESLVCRKAGGLSLAISIGGGIVASDQDRPGWCLRPWRRDKSARSCDKADRSDEGSGGHRFGRSENPLVRNIRHSQGGDVSRRAGEAAQSRRRHSGAAQDDCSVGGRLDERLTQKEFSRGGPYVDQMRRIVRISEEHAVLPSRF